MNGLHERFTSIEGERRMQNSMTMTAAAPDRDDARSTPPRQACGLAPPVSSNALLQGRKTVEISHNGAIYRLQATKLGKLILTK